MSRMHKTQRALQRMAGPNQPWYYKPLVWFYRWPYRWWRRVKADLLPVLVIQGGRWNSNSYVQRKALESKAKTRVKETSDPALIYGPIRKGWLYDRPPGSVAPQRSYVRPADAPKPTAWKPDEAAANP